jgi:hypothetical protein
MPSILCGLFPSSFLAEILLILAYIAAEDIANHQARYSNTFLSSMPLQHQDPLMHKFGGDNKWKIYMINGFTSFCKMAVGISYLYFCLSDFSLKQPIFLFKIFCNFYVTYFLGNLLKVFTK